MKALELHYTSCRRGRSGSAGFQTRALTPGITPDEQREIERQGIYRPPHDAVEEPSSEEIERDFPLALRFYTLESGRLALTRSCYTGRDYSGRWGNFFAHTLVFENQPPSLWPIDYYEWPHWKSGLSPAEDTDEEPPTLPAVDVAEVVPSESFQLKEIGEFLREEPGRVELLAAMGRAVLLGLESSRAVVIRDTPTRNLYWIAGVQKLFPPQHAATLSTSSYQEDPRNCAAVNATAGETSFAFSDTERCYQFYMFDFDAGIHSEVPSDAADYPAIAARWLADHPNALRGFFEFTRLFDHQRVEPELLSALRLFELSRQRDRHLEGEDLAAMIRFAARWATAEGRIRLMEVIAMAVERIGGLRQAADYAGVIQFLADGAISTAQRRHRALAFATWQQLLDGQVVRRSRGLDTAIEAWDYLRRTHAAHVEELAGKLLEPELWQAWRHRLPELPTHILTSLLRIVWSSLEIVGRLPAWEQSEVGSLVRALVDRPGEIDQLAQTVLEAIPVDAGALSAVSQMVPGMRQDTDRRRSQIQVGRALGRVLGKVPATAGDAVRHHLDGVRARDLLFGEWREICDTADDPEAAFRSYQKAVLAKLPDYGRRCSSWVASSVLDHLSPERRVPLVLDWLRDGEVDGFPAELARRCLASANAAVPLDLRARGGDEIATLVAESAARLQTPLRPDRPFLRWASQRIQVKNTQIKDLELKRLEAALTDVQANDYSRFLAAFLPDALGLVGNLGEHRKVLLATFRAEHKSHFQKFYRKFLRAKKQRRWPECMHAALKFWLNFDRCKADSKHLTPLEKTAREDLASVLSRLKSWKIKEVRGNLRLTQQGASRWQQLLEMAEKQKRRPLRRLVHIFSRR